MYVTNNDASGKSYTHMWDVESTKTLEGGFLLIKTNLPSTMTSVPKGSFFKVDFVERKATLIKTAVVYEAIDTNATTLKLKKNAYLVNGDILGIGGKGVAVASLDTSNAAYDAITITAGALGALSAGDILQTYNAAGSSKTAVNPDGVSYREKTIETETDIDVIFKADGVVASALPFYPTAAIIAALNKFQFNLNS